MAQDPIVVTVFLVFTGAAVFATLALYARHFSMTEINATAYQLPRAETLERRRRQVPPTFLFAVRLTRTLTHEIDAQRWPGLAKDYRDGLAPLIQTRQLAAVLIQLPPTFDRTAAHRRHLAALLDMLRGLPLAIEFRHRSWANDRVLNELERRQVALVTVDGPPAPAIFPVRDAVTSPDLFCIRFYGRNGSGWRSGKTSRQFDYCYTDDELCEFIRGGEIRDPLSRCLAAIADEMARTYITNDHWYRVPETWWHGVADVGVPLNTESADG